MLKCALLHRFQSLIAAHSGLTIAERGRGDLRDALIVRMDAIGIYKPADYYGLLEAKTEAAEIEWNQLVPLLTNRIYYFFRDVGQLALLRDQILPKIITRNAVTKCLHIWSAGGATGEEAYGLAILVHSLIPEWQEWDIRILATDIDEEALHKAQNGVYPPSAFRMIEPDIWNGYYQETEEGCELIPSIKEAVSFQRGNLLIDTIPETSGDNEGMDLILCRNVFVWFQRAEIALVLPKLAASLKPGGYLMTGHLELRDHDLGCLHPRLEPEGLIYQRAVDSSGPEEDSFALMNHSPTPIVMAEREFRNGIYTKVVEVLTYPEDRTHSYTDDYLLFLAFLKLGDLERALRTCVWLMKLDCFAVAPYTLMARAWMGVGNIEEAKRLLLKALYLAPADLLAWVELGDVCEQMGDGRSAGRIRSIALGIARNLRPSEPVEPYNPKTAAELALGLQRQLSKGFSP